MMHGLGFEKNPCPHNKYFLLLHENVHLLKSDIEEICCHLYHILTNLHRMLIIQLFLFEIHSLLEHMRMGENIGPSPSDQSHRVV